MGEYSSDRGKYLNRTGADNTVLYRVYSVSTIEVKASVYDTVVLWDFSVKG